jgi:hypothetical protein
VEAGEKGEDLGTDRWAKKNAPDDLGDNAWLADITTGKDYGE